jgi:excisionase family DNA binding protein
MTAAARTLEPLWYTTDEVAQLLNFGKTKTKFLILEGEIRSTKIGRNRRILPEWVREYVQRTTQGA